jgi:hypothetical protein
MTTPSRSLAHRLTSRSILFAAVWLAILGLRVAYGEEPTSEHRSHGGAQDHPVILLTGFEPFGPGKPANLVEGIRQLDGRAWRDTRWSPRDEGRGAPLVQLITGSTSSTQSRLLFGQGLPAVSRSRRGLATRGGNGQSPRVPLAASLREGPDEFAATADAAKLVAELEREHCSVRSPMTQDNISARSAVSLEPLVARQSHGCCSVTRRRSAEVAKAKVTPEYVQHRRAAAGRMGRIARDCPS